MIQLDASAPDWARRFAKDVEAYVTQKLSEPRPLPTFTVANKPPANLFRGCAIWLSDSAGNRQQAISNGSAWYYMDGTAV